MPPTGRPPADGPTTGRHTVGEPPPRPAVPSSAPPVPSPPPEHPSGPLDITPRRSGRSRAFLAVVFVLLALAAVAIAVLILRGGSLSGPTMIQVTGTGGTVYGWEGVLTGPAGDGPAPPPSWTGPPVPVVR